MSFKEHNPSGTKNYPLSKEDYDKMMDRILNVYPKDINLIEFVQQRKFGYTIDLKSSSKNAVVLQQQKDGISHDTIIVRKNKDTHQFYYTNPNVSTDKGPIWKFVMNRLQTTSYIAVDKELSEYLNIDNLKSVEPQIRKVDINTSPLGNRSVEMVKHYNLTPLTDYNYLKSRGLSENVLNSYEFAGRVLNERGGSKGQFVNTAFPMYNRLGEIVGIERKNFAYNAGDKSFGGAAEGSDKAHSVWYSKIKNDVKIDNFVLGEAPIDLMSYHQLRKSKLEHNFYIGSNGYWTNNQREIVQEFITKHQPKHIILANDNDNSGKRFNISLLGHINRPLDTKELEKNPLSTFEPKPLITKDNKLTVDCDLENKFTVRLRFNAVFDKQSDGVKIFQEIEKRIQEIRSVSSQDVLSRIPETSDNKGVYEVTFVNATLELNKAQEIVRSLRGMDNYISIEKSRGKDFNEDLQVAVGIKKDPYLENNPQAAKMTPEELKRRESFNITGDLNERKTGLGR